ncbi:MAG: outer membrane beta-barrel protein [Simkaniaceae bacterium]|nr:outer membrane beta-barrel protein [Simkaniaceae bacterium]
MRKWIPKSLIAALILPCFALTAQESDQQQTPSDPMGIYFGGFGGWIYPYHVTVTQVGTAFFTEGAGGPLDVAAKGTSHGNTKGFGGVHIGYEWMNKMSPGFRLAPALELEGTYFANTAKKADVVNPTTRIDAHEFIDTLPMRVGTLLVNGVLEFNNDYISPYLGFGVGVGFISIHNANSLQIDPLEAGFNHFNSNTSAFNTLFATQAKAGLRYRFLKHYRLSAEYRFIYLPSSDFTFGSTNYPDHVPTSPWLVRLSGMRYNTFTLGFDFIF